MTKFPQRSLIPPRKVSRTLLTTTTLLLPPAVNIDSVLWEQSQYYLSQSLLVLRPDSYYCVLPQTLNSEGLQTLLDCKRKPSLGEKNAHNFAGGEQLICQGTAYSPERPSRGCHPAFWWPEMRSNVPTLVPSLLLARVLCGSWAALSQWSFNSKWGILRVFWGGLSLENAFVSLWLFFDKVSWCLLLWSWIWYGDRDHWHWEEMGLRWAGWKAVMLKSLTNSSQLSLKIYSKKI